MCTTDPQWSASNASFTTRLPRWPRICALWPAPRPAMLPTGVPSVTVLVGNDVRTFLGKSARGAPRRSDSEAWA
eukprot:5763598-Prorocentrum_lima.AAC.1